VGRGQQLAAPQELQVRDEPEVEVAGVVEEVGAEVEVRGAEVEVEVAAWDVGADVGAAELDVLVGAWEEVEEVAAVVYDLTDPAVVPEWIEAT